MNRGSGKVLYHAVSSYQLLEVLLHRRLFHPEEEATLLLPDFIVEKYPQWPRLQHRGFFDEVKLFPYLHIPHGEEAQVVAATQEACRSLELPPLEAFSKIYIAGAHFYFSLAVLDQGLPFSLFEDAAGALSHPRREAVILGEKFPQHAAIALKHGLFSGENPLIREVFCCGEAQTRPLSLPGQVWDFSVERALRALPRGERGRLCRFFLPRPVRTKAQVVLLTQQFSNLGMLGEEQQRALYRSLAEGPLKGVPLLVKKHPDDPLDYQEVFPRAQIVSTPFPAELLPYFFRGRRPRQVWAFGSTALANLGESFQIVDLSRADGYPAPVM